MVQRFNISAIGSSITIKQTGDTYGASSLSLINRARQSGFVATTAGSYTLADFALQNSAANSLRTIRLDSRISPTTTGQHSL